MRRFIIPVIIVGLIGWVAHQYLTTQRGASHSAALAFGSHYDSWSWRFGLPVNHDWSFQVGNCAWQSVGLWGVESPGMRAETWVCWGFGHFSLPVHIYAFTAMAVISLLTLIASYLWPRYRLCHDNAA